MWREHHQFQDDRTKTKMLILPSILQCVFELNKKFACVQIAFYLNKK